MDAAGAARAIVVSSVLLISTAVPAVAQDTTGAPPGSSVNWRIAGGYGWFSFRDVARTGRPLDASPVSWSGRGFSMEAERTRSSTSRMHRLTAGLSMTGNFEYRSPIETTARPSSDHYRAFDGHYEYRRYLLRDLGLTGLDVGLGGQAVGQYGSMARSVATAITSRDTVLSGGMAVVVAARLRRWSAFRAEVDWANGIRIARLAHQHSETASTGAMGGGGWFMDFGITSDFRLTPRTSLSVRYSSGSVAQYSSHRPIYTSHGALTAGVVYAR